MKADKPGELTAYVFRMDPGGQARLRRGADTADLLLIPGFARLLAEHEGADLRRALFVARVAAVLGGPGSVHPGTALAEAGLHERRMGRLLASGPEVLPDRLLVMARFLSAKRARAEAVPFYWLLREIELGESSRNRALWARSFGEASGGRDVGAGNAA